jgi:hypothetical protein
LRENWSSTITRASIGSGDGRQWSSSRRDPVSYLVGLLVAITMIAAL